MSTTIMPMVLELSSPRDFRILKTLNPSAFGHLDPHDPIEKNFLVLDWPNDGELVLMDHDELEKAFNLVGYKPPIFWAFKFRLLAPR